MYNFKEFFAKNFDYTILMEARANRGTYIKSPILIDEEDLDFLYQIDQNYWSEALQSRIQKTWGLLKYRQNIRNKIIRNILSEIKSKFGLSKTAAGGVRVKKRIISIDTSNLEDFKNFILSLSSKYDNYGQESSSSPETREELSSWLDNLVKDYDLMHSSSGGYDDNFRTIRDLIYEVIKHIVIYVKGGDQEEYSVGDKKIKFYINRYIEKLETLPGDEHTIKTRLDHLSQVYGKEIKFETHGKYGVDLSNARKIKSDKSKAKGKDTIYKVGSGTEGFDFSKSAAEGLKNLYSLNYHRHFGSLPTDDPSHEKDVTYKVVRSGTGTRKEVLADKEVKNRIQTNIFNFIKRFIGNNKTMSSWQSENAQDFFRNELYTIKDKDEVESGVWLIRYILKDPTASIEDLQSISENIFKKLFSENLDKLEELKTKGKIGEEAFKWMTSWPTIVNNNKLKDLFAKYFSEKLSKEILGEQGVHGPKILSVDITGDPIKDGEMRKKELDRMDEKDKEELKKILGKDWESFERTGRIPYRIMGNKLRIGEKGGESPLMILPYLKVGEGDNTRSVPLLNIPSFIRAGSSLEDKNINKLRNRIIDSLEKLGIDVNSIDFYSSDDLEKLLSVDKIDSKIKESIQQLINATSVEVKKLTTTSRSSVVFDKDGKERIFSKFYQTPEYIHGGEGARLAGFRPEVSGQQPGSPHNKETKIALAKIFPIDSEAFYTIPASKDGKIPARKRTLVDKKTWDYFKRNPDLFPKDSNPMRWAAYAVVDKSKQSIGESSYFDLSQFKLIKEADDYEEEEYNDDDFFDNEDGDDDEDRSAEGARKGKTGKTSKRGSGKSFYKIEEVEEGTGDFEGWSDIIRGITNTVLNKALGGGDAYDVDIKKIVERDMNTVHDDIVYYFYNNVKDRTLYTPQGRQNVAKSEAGKMLQAAGVFSGGGLSRRSRTDLEGSPGGPKAYVEPEINIDELKPLAYSLDLDKQTRSSFVSIFVDTSETMVLKRNGKRVWLQQVTMPDAPEARQSCSFRSDEENLRNKIYSTSNILRFLSENSEKINLSNYQKIVDNLEIERKNLLKYWSEKFPLLSKVYEGELKKIPALDLIPQLEEYLRNSNEKISQTINSLYDAEIKNQESKKNNQTQRQEIPTGRSLENGYNQLKEIIGEVESIMEDESYKLPSTRLKFHKPLVSDPIIIAWFDSINNFMGVLNLNPSLIQVILKHMGQWSPVGQRLREKEIEDAKKMLRKMGVEPSNDEQDLFKQLFDFNSKAPIYGKIKIPSTTSLKHQADNFLNKLALNLSEFTKLAPEAVEELKKNFSSLSDKNKKVISNGSILKVSSQYNQVMSIVRSLFMKQSR